MSSTPLSAPSPHPKTWLSIRQVLSTELGSFPLAKNQHQPTSQPVHTLAGVLARNNCDAKRTARSKV